MSWRVDMNLRGERVTLEVVMIGILERPKADNDHPLHRGPIECNKTQNHFRVLQHPDWTLTPRELSTAIVASLNHGYHHVDRPASSVESVPDLGSGEAPGSTPAQGAPHAP